MELKEQNQASPSPSPFSVELAKRKTDAHTSAFNCRLSSSDYEQILAMLRKGHVMLVCSMDPQIKPRRCQFAYDPLPLDTSQDEVFKAVPHSQGCRQPAISKRLFRNQKSNESNSDSKDLCEKHELVWRPHTTSQSDWQETMPLDTLQVSDMILLSLMFSLSLMKLM